MTFPLESTLPDELKSPNNQFIIKRAVTQFSQIVAWTWSDDYLAFGTDGNEELISQEKQLKKFLIEIFINQSIYSAAFVCYNNESATIPANGLAKSLTRLFKSENDQIKPEDIIPVDLEIPTLTLNEVCKKMTGNDLILSLEDGKKFIDMFYPIVMTNTFNGRMEKINDPENKNGLTEKYISYCSFPPPYPLNDTIKQHLKNWATEDTNETGNYLPPLLVTLAITT